MNLAMMLVCRHSRTSDAAGLEDAVQYGLEAFTEAPKNDLDRALAVRSFSNILFHKYLKSGKPSDLDMSIEIGREALSVSSNHLSRHLSRAGCLNDLGNSLRHRHQNFRTSSTDLDEGIKLLRQATDAVPSDHSSQAIHFRNLSKLLMEQYHESVELVDPKEVVSCYQKALSVTAAPTNRRIHAAE